MTSIEKNNPWLILLYAHDHCAARNDHDACQLIHNLMIEVLIENKDMAKFHTVHRDANHIEIVRDLRKQGYIVIDLAAVGNSVPDIVVADAALTALIEIKMPKSQVYIAQLEFLARWPGVAGFAQTTEDAIAIMTDPKKRLTDHEKTVILQICAEYRKNTTDLRPRIRIMEFEKRFAEMRLNP